MSSMPPAVPPAGGSDAAKPGADPGGTRLRRWQAATEWPLTAVALLFLVAYGVPIAFPGVGPAARAACAGVLALTWAVFVADYVVRVFLAPHSWRYVRRHPLELAVVVVPVLRPLLLISVVARLNQARRMRLRGKVVRFAATGTALLVLVGALVVTQAERRSPEANITDVGEGLWWAMVTIATVGYGDYTPVTPLGRVVAVGMMLGGVALLGVVTATLSSWLVERVAAAPGPGAGGPDAGSAGAAEVPVGGVVTPAQVALLMGEVEALRAELAEARRRAEDQRADPADED
ncbi:potassium channel family protein [Isoptericola sp. BMS4]|uniref:potassium channel family protein n=1 Tax=Isoptericola sp. BMS4 TaxID=2527875 RepID=UPI001F1067A4|nr:potassium channel family protein [Isoptericola sp. BMS4]